MPHAKTWSELTRRQRQGVRGFLRDDIRCIEDGSVPGQDEKWERKWVEAARAALRELKEPKRD